MAVLSERIEKEIEKIVTGEMLELVHIEVKPQGRGMLLRIDIDKEGGVTIEDCQNISYQVSTFLDVEDPIEAEFELQVSSPGLDRKFYRESDYQKFQGRLVRIKTRQMVKGLYVIVGHLVGYTGAAVTVEDPQSRKDYDIELSNIKEARLEVEF